MSSSLLNESEARRNVNYLAGLDLIISLGFGLIMPLFPLYLSYLADNATDVGIQVGILFSSFMLMRAILAAPFGNLSDRVGRKKIILIGSFFYAILAILFTVPESWSGLLFVRAFQGVASAMVWPVSEALVIDSSPPSMRGASLGKIVMASNMGMVIGPFVGAALFGIAHRTLGFSLGDSYRFPFYFTAIIAFCGGLLVWRNVTDAVVPRESKTKLSLRQIARPEGVDRLGLRNLRVLYANAAMEGFAFASIGPLMALFLLFRFPNLGGDTIPVIVGVGMGLGALVAYPSGRMADRLGKKKVFVLGGYLAFVGTMLIPMGGLLGLVIVFLAMRSMAFQVSSPALRALQADIVPEAIRGRLIGVLESMSNVGSVVGAIAGGLLWDYFHGIDLGLPEPFDGTVIPFVISGLLGVFTVSMVQLLVKDGRA
ncbi:MAG: MFS transporter [Candidatus Thermoplasmatota archaeon]|nr:MFS transporter [Candidatus Thermoplasmatota archaeon]